MTEQGWLQKIIRWWTVRRCEHCWRPAVKEIDKPTGMPFIVRRVSVPVRLCGKCEHFEVIGQKEFYAQFGRMPW